MPRVMFLTAAIAGDPSVELEKTPLAITSVPFVRATENSASAVEILHASIRVKLKGLKDVTSPADTRTARHGGRVPDIRSLVGSRVGEWQYAFYLAIAGVCGDDLAYPWPLDRL